MTIAVRPAQVTTRRAYVGLNTHGLWESWVALRRPVRLFFGKPAIPSPQFEIGFFGTVVWGGAQGGGDDGATSTARKRQSPTRRRIEITRDASRAWIG